MAVSFSIICVFLLYHWLSCVTSQTQTDAVTSQSRNEASARNPVVQEIMIPMCKNLVPYNVTRLPNSMGHRTQRQVYRAIEHLWAYMDYDCSHNFRTLVCSAHLPQYNEETEETIGPCKSTCNRAKRGCGRVMRQAKAKWPRQLRCRRFPTRDCIPPVPERRASQRGGQSGQPGQAAQPEYPYCTANTLPMCSNLPYAYGYLPNYYHQYNITEVGLEMQFYNPLLETRCNPNLAFFLCGTYMPFCVRDQFRQFTIPCRELCDQVVADCAEDYRSLYHGIPWPNKLQCHRYWLSSSSRTCAMPGDVTSTDNIEM